MTTLPAVSYSMTVGDGTAVTVSGETRLPRLTVNTWSWESTHVPATSPVTQGLGLPVAVLIAGKVPNWPATGSGFGQLASTCNTGTLSVFLGSALSSRNGEAHGGGQRQHNGPCINIAFTIHCRLLVAFDSFKT